DELVLGGGGIQLDEVLVAHAAHGKTHLPHPCDRRGDKRFGLGGRRLEGEKSRASSQEAGGAAHALRAHGAGHRDVREDAGAAPDGGGQRAPAHLAGRVDAVGLQPLGALAVGREGRGGGRQRGRGKQQGGGG